MATADPFTVLTIAAGLALAVERALESVKHIIDSKAPISKLEALNQIKDVAANAVIEAQKAVKLAKQGVAYTPIDSTPAAPPIENNQNSSDSQRTALLEIQGIKILPATPRPQDKKRRYLFYQLMTVGMGILLADLFDVRLFSAFFQELSPQGNPFSNHQFIDELFTGLIIGGGSHPVHLVLGFLTNRWSDSISNTNQRGT